MCNESMNQRCDTQSRLSEEVCAPIRRRSDSCELLRSRGALRTREQRGGRTTAVQATLIERIDQRGRTHAACRYRRYTHAVTMERGGNAGTPSPRNGDRPQSYAGYRAFPSSLDSLSVAEGTPPVVAAGKFAASGQGGPPPSRAASLGNRCRCSCVFVRVCLLSTGHV